MLLLLIWYQSNFVVETIDTQAPLPSTPGSINYTDTNFEVVIHPEGWQSPVYDNNVDIFENENILSIDETITTEKIDKTETQILEDGDETIGILPININDNTNNTTTFGPDSIVLSITKDSWVEIYDNNDQRLFMDLGRAGEKHKINGTAPFNIILGFSEGVTIEFNGKAFDIAPYSKDGVARFNLPPQ